MTSRHRQPTLVLIDGEHYPPVVRTALAQLPHAVVAALLVGGTEKLTEVAHHHYGVRVLRTELETALAVTGATHVVDLCDEPVLAPPQRMRMISRALACGASYEGADFSFTPPPQLTARTASISFIGTGKRVGKTTLVTHAARTLAADRRLVVLAMGRGGPAQPELVTTAPTLPDLLTRARADQHAASDYLEHAVLAGVPTVGCRRCGGGLAGAPFTSNVAEGMRLADSLNPDLILLDSSGATLPPVRSDRRILVVPAHLPPRLVTDHLNTYRVLVSDLVVITQAERGGTLDRLSKVLSEIKQVPMCAIRMRPRCTADVSGLRVAFFSTATPAAARQVARRLERRHGCRVVHVSNSLADRTRLRHELTQVRAEAYVVEIKAAAIDSVAECAVSRNIPVAFCRYKPQTLTGWPGLTAELSSLASSIQHAERHPR